ncbi:MAG: photosynthetic reaction center subunit H [Rhodoferax sp.]|nr:photosynthetic reaction center subunit H [Rhodoferax sp.]
METGAITPYVDVAQVVLYVFWAFFAGLIYYLVRENHREGYPMDSGRANGPKVTGWPVPEPVSYKMQDGRVLLAPDFNRPDGDYQAEASHPWVGAPLEPVGDPLLAGVGPGAWAQRADLPDMMSTPGELRIVPLRRHPDHGVAKQDLDPRGMSVFGKDGAVAGTVKDLWVDRSEILFRYLEVALPDARTVLLPVPFCRIKASGVQVGALLASQFANVPQLRNPDQVTLLEEEKISAYYGAGLLYATADIQEPLF